MRLWNFEKNKNTLILALFMAAALVAMPMAAVQAQEDDDGGGGYEEPEQQAAPEPEPQAEPEPQREPEQQAEPEQPAEPEQQAEPGPGDQDQPGQAAGQVGEPGADGQEDDVSTQEQCESALVGGKWDGNKCDLGTGQPGAPPVDQAAEPGATEGPDATDVAEPDFHGVEGEAQQAAIDEPQPDEPVEEVLDETAANAVETPEEQDLIAQVNGENVEVDDPNVFEDAPEGCDAAIDDGTVAVDLDPEANCSSLGGDAQSAEAQELREIAKANLPAARKAAAASTQYHKSLVRLIAEAEVPSRRRHGGAMLRMDAKAMPSHR